VIAREALGSLAGRARGAASHEADPGLRWLREHPFELAIPGPSSQLSDLRPVLVATAAFHAPVAKCMEPVVLSLALLTHLPSALEPLELRVPFSQPGCALTPPPPAHGLQPRPRPRSRCCPRGRGGAQGTPATERPRPGAPAEGPGGGGRVWPLPPVQNLDLQNPRLLPGSASSCASPLVRPWTPP